MLKHLIPPVLALALTLSANVSAHAQAKIGFALNYEHIQSPALWNVGSGSGYGGSLFFRFPFSHRFELDGSLDLAGGHTTYQYYLYPPYPNDPELKTAKRSFFKTTIPVHLVYSLSFRQVRVFAGAGPAFSFLSVASEQGHAWTLGPSCNTLSASFMAGFELYQRIVISGEFRPWNTVVSTNKDQYHRYKISNLLSVKLGYELPMPKHFSRVHSGE